MLCIDIMKQILCSKQSYIKFVLDFETLQNVFSQQNLKLIQKLLPD